MKTTDRLVTVNNGIATVEVASNPVAVSGYTSALKSIQSSDTTIKVLSKAPFTTNTKFDGKEHKFDYVSKFSFTSSRVRRYSSCRALIQTILGAQ